MGMLYLQQRLERAILRHADEGDEVSTVMNEIVEQGLIERGWYEPPAEEEAEAES